MSQKQEVTNSAILMLIGRLSGFKSLGYDRADMDIDTVLSVLEEVYVSRMVEDIIKNSFYQSTDKEHLN